MPELTREQAVAALKPIHQAVRQHTSYRRVYSNKRLTGPETEYDGITGNCLHGHRIKYTHCDPSVTVLMHINQQLLPMGLIAYRLARTNVNGDKVPPQLEIRLLWS